MIEKVLSNSIATKMAYVFHKPVCQMMIGGN